MDETWLPVVGFEGLYEVSNAGRVRSLDRWVRTSHGNGRKLVRGRVMATPLVGEYPNLKLSREGRTQGRYVHHLVLEAHAGPCPPGHIAIHGRGGHLDNRYPENIRWGTHAGTPASKPLRRVCLGCGTVFSRDPHSRRRYCSARCDRVTRKVRRAGLPVVPVAPVPSPPIEDTGQWGDRAACRGDDSDAWFNPVQATRTTAICQRCPVREQCLDFGKSEAWGVWGGVPRWGRAPRQRVAS